MELLSDLDRVLERWPCKQSGCHWAGNPSRQVQTIEAIRSIELLAACRFLRKIQLRVQSLSDRIGPISSGYRLAPIDRTEISPATYEAVLYHFRHIATNACGSFSG